MAGDGISDGMIVGAIAREDWENTIGPLRTGITVVARATRGDPPEEEISLRRVLVGPTDTKLITKAGDNDLDYPALVLGEGVEVIAVVTRAVKLFLDLEAA